MPEFLEELSQIVQEMEDLNQNGHEVGLRKTLHELYKAAYEVGESWSKSWLGYHANVYYKDFLAPEAGAYFNKRWGLRNSRNTGARTSGDWIEYDPQQVIEEIDHRAGDPNMSPILSFKQRADDRIRITKRNILSIIDIAISQRNSPLLADIKDELSKLSTSAESEVVNGWRPEPGPCYDLTAIQQGRKTPPHLQIAARVLAIQSTSDSVGKIIEIANQTKLHISRQHRYVDQIGPTGNRVFIGHGRSRMWLELKDFVEDQLGLPVDEFNRVPAAGTSITDRLMEMLHSATIAFLVMTGEDEQPTGELRPRENVVHEAGLFQGHLGFKQAILLLEEGCEKFSNNAGLVHINFPKNNIRAAFQDVREVLEREGVRP